MADDFEPLRHDRLRPETDRAVAASGRAEKEFRRAARHSRLVKVLKIGLPAAALLIVGAGLVVTWIARALPDNVTIGATTLENGRIVMDDPRLSGFDSDQRPYSMVAQEAVQSLDGGRIDLKAISANLAIDDDTVADIAAARGSYDPEAEKLTLSEAIEVDTSSGISIELQEARIDLKRGRLVSDAPVRIEMPNQTIEAGKLTVKDGGSVLSFGDRVRMTLVPDPAGNDSAQLTEGE